MKNKKDKMGIAMNFNNVLLVFAFIFILMTKPDNKVTDDCTVPGHYHDKNGELQEMDDLDKEEFVNKIE